MRRLPAFLLLLLITLRLNAIVGLSDWRESSPNGLVMDNFSGNGTSLHLDGNEILSEIRAWYFYKGHIIGSRDSAWTYIDPISFENLEAQSGYFVVHEKSRRLMQFSDYNSWKSHLEKSDLVPKLWTRWYSDDWKFFNDRFLIFILLGGFIVLIPLLIVFSILIYRMVVNDKFDKKKLSTKLVIAMSICCLCLWIFDQLPQSI